MTKEVTILVDADATPRDVLVTTDGLANQFGAKVVTVSTINHEFDRPNHITVDAHPQAADMEIVSRIQTGQTYIVITQDYGLAALVLGKGARAVGPRGLEYTNHNIDLLLLERDLHARERKQGRRNRGPSARTHEDAEEFAQTLRRVLSELAGAR